MSTCTATITAGGDTGVRTRRAYWAHVGETLGLPLADGQLDEADDLSDVAVVERYFPHLGDAERHEVLWALGAYLRGG